MTLRQAQSLFAFHAAQLILRIFEQGYSCTFGEALRTPEQAALNAAKGSGISNSLHCDKLALDLNLFDKAGVYQIDGQLWLPIGEWWERQHKLAAWGGRFLKKDFNHFSFKWEGRK